MEGLHGGHVGWQEQYKFSPLGKQYVFSCKNISLFLPSNMATMQTLHRLATPLVVLSFSNHSKLFT